MQFPETPLLLSNVEEENRGGKRFENCRGVGDAMAVEWCKICMSSYMPTVNLKHFVRYTHTMSLR